MCLVSSGNYNFSLTGLGQRAQFQFFRVLQVLSYFQRVLPKLGVNPGNGFFSQFLSYFWKELIFKVCLFIRVPSGSFSIRAGTRVVRGVPVVCSPP